ncbi:acyl carrier protein [Stappia sp. BW2]|nr:acyl carrier protein [Stappia sp. BW2]
MPDLETRTKTVVAETLRLARWVIKPESTMATLGAGSLDVVGIIMALEREFDCCLPDDLFSPNNSEKGQLTFQELVDVIERSTQTHAVDA